jgi:Putative MetA-pathway of phenol degradation
MAALLCFGTSLLAQAGISAPAIPSPPPSLRELSTDRPDTTESAYSVDRGHFQFELELANATRDGGRWTDFSIMEINAKIGLTDSNDLQFVLPLFTKVRGGAEGFGDATIRLKHNLWGNDGGSTALAIMPFVKLPTANGTLGNGKVEGGLVLPFACDAPAGWSCGLMAEVDFLSNEAGDYETSVLLSATASHDLTEATAIFFEGVVVLNFASSSDTEAYFNTGLTWAVAENWQLDGGLRAGLTAASPDLTPFLGVSMKF